MGRTDPIEVAVEIKRETAKALLVDDSSGEVWIPKSQIGNDPDDYEDMIGETVTLEIPEWLAEEKGFI